MYTIYLIYMYHISLCVCETCLSGIAKSCRYKVTRSCQTVLPFKHLAFLDCLISKMCYNLDYHILLLICIFWITSGTGYIFIYSTFSAFSLCRLKFICLWFFYLFCFVLCYWIFGCFCTSLLVFIHLSFCLLRVSSIFYLCFHFLPNVS